MSAVQTLTQSERKLIAWHLVIAVLALFIGSLFGPLQALNWGGIDLYPSLTNLGIKSYYQGLTIHGVLNAVIWTTFFIMAFLTFNVVYGLKKNLTLPALNWAGFWLMVIGLVMAAFYILTNQATVLYTFYPPLQAPWLFYLALALVVVGSWLEGWGFIATYRAWRKEHAGERTPLIALMALITFVIWQLATIGVAIEVLALLIPWAAGLTQGIDVELARTFFWWFGHPLVYFWLLPAYISWYAYLPRQAGGKLFSETLSRLAFWLFLLFSVPVGFHHQYVDPGVPPGWRYIHALLTFAVAIPSLMTFFTVIASLEYAGRKNGGTGLFGWMRTLPWGDPAVSSQLLAGILFMFGGIGGLINASYNLNLIMHNSAWVPGHFHLTVGAAVTMTFMGISYWFVPYLTKKPLGWPKLAKIQPWVYFIGMAIFSQALHSLGLAGAPRRTPLGNAPYVPPEWHGLLLRVAIGGTIMFFGLLFYVLVMAKTAFSKATETVSVEPPVAEPLYVGIQIPAWLDAWKPWVIGAVALVLIAYTPVLIELITNMVPIAAPAMKLW